MMDGVQPEYLSYLVRLWRVSDDEEPTWRAVLKSSQTGQQMGFGSLEALFDYVRREAGLEPRANEGDALTARPSQWKGADGPQARSTCVASMPSDPLAPSGADIGTSNTPS